MEREQNAIIEQIIQNRIPVAAGKREFYSNNSSLKKVDWNK
jgi:hypothetical protein